VRQSSRKQGLACVLGTPRAPLARLPGSLGSEPRAARSVQDVPPPPHVISVIITVSITRSYFCVNGHNTYSTTLTSALAHV